MRDESTKVDRLNRELRKAFYMIRELSARLALVEIAQRNGSVLPAVEDSGPRSDGLPAPK